MAYKGGIDYLDLEFGGVDWEVYELRSPWTSGSQDVWHTGDQAGMTEISAVAREFSPFSSFGPESKLIYDIPATSGGPPPVKVVVVGKKKNSQQDLQDTMHYILLITPKTSRATRGGLVYERIGVGHVPGRCIGLEGHGTQIKIW